MQRDPSPTPHIGHNLRQRVAWLPLFPQLPRGPCPHPSLPQTLYLTRDKWLPQLGSLTLLWVAFVAGGGACLQLYESVCLQTWLRYSPVPEEVASRPSLGCRGQHREDLPGGPR